MRSVGDCEYDSIYRLYSKGEESLEFFQVPRAYIGRELGIFPSPRAYIER